PPAITQSDNLEFPANSCATNSTVADPNLDPLYIPILGSPAKGSGDLATCLADPVSARDVYGKKRPQGTSCSIGAVEGEMEKEISDTGAKRNRRDKNGPSSGPIGTGPVGTGPVGTGATGPAGAGSCCCIWNFCSR